MITHVAVKPVTESEPGRIRALTFYFESGNVCSFDWPSGRYTWMKRPTREEREEAENTIKSVPVKP
jgi:hypothetical protein